MARAIIGHLQNRGTLTTASFHARSAHPSVCTTESTMQNKLRRHNVNYGTRAGTTHKHKQLTQHLPYMSLRSPAFAYVCHACTVFHLNSLFALCSDPVHIGHGDLQHSRKHFFTDLASAVPAKEEKLHSGPDSEHLAHTCNAVMLCMCMCELTDVVSSYTTNTSQLLRPIINTNIDPPYARRYRSCTQLMRCSVCHAEHVMQRTLCSE